MNAPHRVVKFLGLADRNGDVSFNKLVTGVALILFALMVLRELDPSPWVLTFGIVVIGAGFGLKGYMAGAARVNLSGTSSTSITGDAAELAKVILDRRDPASGVDPS